MKAFLDFCRELKRENALIYINVYNYLDVYIEIRSELSKVINSDVEFDNIYNLNNN